MKLITLYLPETYIKALDQLVAERFYPNRAEAIRFAIRDLINSEVWSRRSLSSHPEPDLRKTNKSEKEANQGKEGMGNHG